MKTLPRIIVLGLLLSLSSSVFSQSSDKISFSNYVGIGTFTPNYKLTLEGSNSGGDPLNDNRTYLFLKNTQESTASVTNIQIKAGISNSSTFLNHASASYGTDYYGLKYANFGQLWSTGAGLILRAGSSNTPEGVIKFMTGTAQNGDSNERMLIDSNGYVGIGTSTPTSKLQITNGDVYIDNPSKGIILKSPDGSCWRVTVNNDGYFSNTKIVCP